MYSMLVAVDGSTHAEHALRHAIDVARRMAGAVRILLVNVQPPAMSGEVSNLMTAEEVMQRHTEMAKATLAPARELLDAAGIAHETEILVGRPAEELIACARRRECDIIVVGASRRGPVGSLVLGSVATRVIHLADVPVTVVH